MSNRVKTKASRELTSLQEAAERAFENGEYETAVELFSKAIGIEGLADETCFQLLSGRAGCYSKLSQIESEMLDRKALVDLSDSMDDRTAHIQALLDYARVSGLHGLSDESLTSSELARELSRELGDKKLEADSNVSIGETYRALGESPDSIDNLQTAIELYLQIRHKQG